MDEADEQDIATDIEPAALYKGSDSGAFLLRRPDWAFLLWWVVANTAGATVGAFVTQAITGGVWGSRVEIIGNAVATGLLLGASIGLVEWLVLRVFLSGMVWWIPATSLGWAVGLMTNAYLLKHGTYPESAIEFAVAIGAAVSLAQYITLWRRIPLAELWIMVSVVAWVIVVITMPQIGHFTYLISPISGDVIPDWLDVLRNLIHGVWLFGVLETATGLTLIWLLRRAMPLSQPSHAVLLPRANASKSHA